jgi:hypothetical protein
VQRSAFVYTSFVNTSLVSICFAGLMINFLSGFAFSLMIKWTKNGSETGLWAPIPKDDVANISLCYGIFKGVLQVTLALACTRRLDPHARRHQKKDVSPRALPLKFAVSPRCESR